ncbi:MAG: FkbM family methyltransferase [Saprospirales bacterium]|nr:FkbM family methyltransferase [Saprospirales bacterium]
MSGLASVYQRNLDFIDIKMDKIEKISVKKMDDYCIENNISEITFLKIDVEGNELSVLNGAKKLLSENKIKYIQFEFGGCNIDSRTYFKDFYDLLNEKYKVYRILRDGLFHIEKYSENLEIFVTSNFFAELK